MDRRRHAQSIARLGRQSAPNRAIDAAAAAVAAAANPARQPEITHTPRSLGVSAALAT